MCIRPRMVRVGSAAHKDISIWSEASLCLSGVDGSETMANLARQICTENGLDSKNGGPVTILAGKVEEVRLPEDHKVWPTHSSHILNLNGTSYRTAVEEALLVALHHTWICNMFSCQALIAKNSEIVDSDCSFQLVNKVTSQSTWCIDLALSHLLDDGFTSKKVF